MVENLVEFIPQVLLGLGSCVLTFEIAVFIVTMCKCVLTEDGYIRTENN